jgi:5-methylcytosine-specific restriction endonuclease McrA
VYLPKRNYKRKSKRKKGGNQLFYKRAAWKKTRLAYLSQFPICEVADYCGDIMEGEIVDHIVPISQGGAPYDPRNFCTMSKRLHDLKSALEQNRGVLVDYTRSQDGYFIPIDKSELWKALEKHYRHKIAKEWKR